MITLPHVTKCNNPAGCKKKTPRFILKRTESSVHPVPGQDPDVEVVAVWICGDCGFPNEARSLQQPRGQS